jgi:hypothetical protein
MKNITIILILINIAYLASSLNTRRELFGKCLTDSNCKSNEYCDQDFPNPLGECKTGKKDGELCLKDSKCASKRCSFLTCKARLQTLNGPCKVALDCQNTQFCEEIKDTDGLKKCVDRKCKGVCKKDSECSSNKCHLFVCVNENNKC